MNTMIETKIYKNDKDTLVMSSIDVADIFGRKHKNVLRAIDNLEISEEFSGLTCEPGSYSEELAPPHF